MFDWSARVTPVNFSPLPKSPHKMRPRSDWALINYAKSVCGEELTWLVIWVASQNTNSWQSFYSKYQLRASVYCVVWYVWEWWHWWESPNSHSHVRWSQMKWNESIAPTRLLINCGIIPNISIIESEWIPFEMLLILWENLTLALRIWG